MTTNNGSSPEGSQSGEETEIKVTTPETADSSQEDAEVAKTSAQSPEEAATDAEATPEEEEVMPIPQLSPDVLAAFPELSNAKDSHEFLTLATARIETAISEMPGEFPNAELILGILRKNIALLEKQPEKARIIDNQASTRHIVEQINGLSQAPAELAQFLETQFQLEMVSAAVSNAYDEYSAEIIKLSDQVSKLETEGRPEDKEALEKAKKDLSRMTTERNHLAKEKGRIRALMAKVAGAGCMKWVIGSLIVAALAGLGAFAAREMVLNRKIRRISRTAFEVADKAMIAHEKTLEAMRLTQNVLKRSLSGLEVAREGGRHSITANLYTMTALSEHTDNEQEYLSNVLLYQVNTLEARLKMRKLLLLTNPAAADRIMPHARLTEGVKGMETNYLEFVARAYASQQYRELLATKKTAIDAILNDQSLNAQQRAERISALPAFSQSEQMDSSNRIFSLVRMTGVYLDHHTAVSVTESVNPTAGQAPLINLRRTLRDNPIANEGALSSSDFAVSTAEKSEERDTRVLRNKSLSDDQFTSLLTSANANGDYSVFSHSVLSSTQFSSLLTKLIESNNLKVLEERVRTSAELQAIITALNTDLQALPSNLLVKKHISDSPSLGNFSQMFQYLSRGGEHMIGNLHGWAIKDRVTHDGQQLPEFVAHSDSLHETNSTQIDALEAVAGRMGREVVQMSSTERAQLERSRALIRDIRQARTRLKTALDEEKGLLEKYRTQAAELNKYYDMDDDSLLEKLGGGVVEGAYDYFIKPFTGPK
jgi:hypothetical protein